MDGPTDGWTDRRTDERTDPLMEMRKPHLKSKKVTIAGFHGLEDDTPF